MRKKRHGSGFHGEDEEGDRFRGKTKVANDRDPPSSIDAGTRSFSNTFTSLLSQDREDRSLWARDRSNSARRPERACIEPLCQETASRRGFCYKCYMRNYRELKAKGRRRTCIKRGCPFPRDETSEIGFCTLCVAAMLGKPPPSHQSSVLVKQKRKPVKKPLKSKRTPKSKNVSKDPRTLEIG